MADDKATEPDYDLDMSEMALSPKPAETPKVEKPVEAPAEPKHKPFFLKAAAKVGISAEEANELEPDELERAIRLASQSTPPVAAAPLPAEKPVGGATEEEDDWADLEGYEEPIVKRFKKLQGELKEAKAAAKVVKELEERERRREEIEYARKVDAMLAKSGIDALGDKPFDEYSPDSPEIIARQQVWAAANAGRRKDEKFETALKRTLKLFSPGKPKAEPEGTPEPEADVKAKLAKRRDDYAGGGVANPIYKAPVAAEGKGRALSGIAAVLSRANGTDK